MKKYLLALIFLSTLSLAYAQNGNIGNTNSASAGIKEKKERQKNPNIFDEKAAIKMLQEKGVKPGEIKGYVQSLKSDFKSKAALKQQTRKHTPYEGGILSPQREIVQSTHRTTSIGCPNASFEQYNFSNWTGKNGTYSGNAASPTYNLNNGIINTAGINAPLDNSTNYHTLLTIPPTNPNYPNCVGYDSLAVPVGGTVSEIPYISPYSLDGVSCRLLGAYGGAKVATLKYFMSVSPLSRLFRYSYAVVLNDGHSGDPTTHQPYLKVTIKDQAGNSIVGCSDYNQDATTAQQPGQGFKQSHLDFGGNGIIYKPWTLVSVDLSSPTYSNVTSISIEFEVAGCSASGHLGYAYVDAECGRGGIATAFCGGPNAVLTAPQGYSAYQWFDPSNNPIAAPSGTNSILTVNSPAIGDVYSVAMTTPGGCTVTLRDTLKTTAVSISYINSAPSCGGGHSGAATVIGAGSTNGYTYTWTAVPSGVIVGNNATATGLAPGNYSVVVASPGCGQASANLSVGTSPPFFMTTSTPFCGSATYITQPGGSNYIWYHGSTPISPPMGNNDSIFVINPVAGDKYTVVYDNTSGCRDSIAFVLVPTTGGNTFISNVANVCPGNSNGSAQINLNTPFSAPYSYSVTNTGGSLILNTSTTATNVTVSPLAPGTYTALVSDGTCIYSNMFTIGNIVTSFTVSATDTVLCFPDDTAKVKINFGVSNPPNCGLATSGCTAPSTYTLFNTGPFTQNSTTNYPTPYGNWYTYVKHQFLVRKTELNAAGITGGKISSLAFKVVNLNASIVTYPNFSIKMGCTSLSNMPSPTTPFLSGLQTVYSTANQPINLGWVEHNFSQAYLWDGVSNIIVEVCFGMNTDFDFSENASIELKQVPYRASLFYSEDVNPVCSGSQQADNSLAMTNGGNMLPNMKFGYCPYSAPAADYTLSVSSNGSVTTNYANDSLMIVPTFTAPPSPNAMTVYTFTAINPEGGCVATRTLAVLYPADNVTVTASATPSSVCIGSPLTLSANGGIIYNWSYLQNGTTLIPISNTQTVSVTPPVVGPNMYVVTGSSPCNSSTDTKTVTVIATQKANLVIQPLSNVIKCMDKDYVINTNVSSTNTISGTPYVYSWTTLPSGAAAPGINTSSSYTYSSNSTTSLVVTVDGNCATQTKDTIVVSNFVNDLNVSITDSSFVCANMEFQLHSTASGGRPDYNYAWYIGTNPTVISNGNSLTYNSPSESGTYTVMIQVTDSCGYSRTDYQEITVLPPCNVEIPNVITPNGDGINEAFIIKNLEYHPNTAVSIFDRWGRKIYTSDNYNNDWKGADVSDGTFFYIVEVPDDKSYSGFVTIFRGK